MSYARDPRPETRRRVQFPTTMGFDKRDLRRATVCSRCGALVVNEDKHRAWHRHYHVDQSEPQVPHERRGA